MRVEAVNVLEHWLLLAEGSRRPGGNTSKKDISFYEEGNQIAGSLLAGWERCESDLKDFCLSHSYSGTVCFVHGAVGWLAGPHVAVASRVLTGWEETLVAGISCGGHMRIRCPGGQ